MKVINSEDGYVEHRVDMFGECEKVIDILSNERVMEVAYIENKNKFIISEMCDEYFGIYLTADMADQLAELFSNISKHIKNEVK